MKEKTKESYSEQIRWIVVDVRHAHLPQYANHWYATASEAADAFINGACVMLDA